MDKAEPSAHTYQLHIRLERQVTVQVGKLGRFVFAPGRYIYTGSAKRNMDARISRHLKRDKALRWHIDYLLTQAGAEVVQVERGNTPECQLNQATSGSIPAPGFGASDCKAGCGSHLKYVGESG